MPDRLDGFLMVGTNERGEVLINLDHDRTGHIVFSPDQAHQLASLLRTKAEEAQHEITVSGKASHANQLSAFRSPLSAL